MGDLETQQEELKILESIYGDLISFENENKIRITFDDDVRLSVKMSQNYPSQEPAQFELSGPSLSREERRTLEDALNGAYLDNLGSPIIFAWINVVKAFLEERRKPVVEPDVLIDVSETSLESNILPSEEAPTIYHGEVFTDRKSHFQAHLARVYSKGEVAVVLQQLLKNPKISRATHNMYAYRFTESRNGRVLKIHDCEDDGETGAGSKMLDLLEKMGADNVIVIVSRWYGGIHLGPDRFRHINNLTREIVVSHGLDARSSNKLT